MPCACVCVSVCLSARTNVVFICGVNCLFHRSIHRCANKFTDALNTSHLNEHTALHSAFDAIVLNNFVMQNVNQIHNIITILKHWPLLTICWAVKIVLFTTKFTLQLHRNLFFLHNFFFCHDTEFNRPSIMSMALFHYVLCVALLYFCFTFCHLLSPVEPWQRELTVPNPQLPSNCGHQCFTTPPLHTTPLHCISSVIELHWSAICCYAQNHIALLMDLQVMLQMVVDTTLFITGISLTATNCNTSFKVWDGIHLKLSTSDKDCFCHSCVGWLP